MANFSFDASQVAPDEGRLGAIPAGWYPVAVDETEMKPTSSGDGAYLNVRFNVLDGPYKNSKVWHRFNTKNASEKAVEIGYKQLSALMHAVKVMKMDRTEQLHNVPLFVKLKFVPPEGQYDSKNEISAFREINDAAAKAGFQGTIGAGAPAAAKTVVPPAAKPAAAPAQAQAAWTPPAAQQPWQAPAAAAPAAAPAEAPAQAAPAVDPNAGQAVQQAQPSWAAAPATVAPAQTTATAAASPAAQAAPSEGAPNADNVPPWMR